MTKKNDGIGYRKPPKHTRFKKGRSGNPKGRPKGSKNFKTEIRDALMEKFTIMSGGKPKRVTAQKAIIYRVREMALKGDPRAVKQVLEMAGQLHDDDLVKDAIKVNEADEEILERFLQSQVEKGAFYPEPGKDGGDDD